ncbi:sigma 54-interacting transcriptional regulator [Enterococcus xiangfangensis]|uniref:sigma 54-interacting transcriptional regulator n=1 Tax=Enterococcus xiangfangensis TaxID=1296537 RepID=UPI0010FA0A8B|nr:sigma 54-interacting transcriptional regulator [Enterococcus xiangfangensis]MBM7712904.1 transcriptional regulator with AAA-type ATPase domain/transcriptional regulatory protein LevR [Enterococcus xiangfangensis]NBK09121.1 PRD domain-containing protein [Enterococcus asini]
MRQETREQLLDLLAQKKASTTQEIADAISLSRSATSLYLNELLDGNEIQKSGTKPVYWSIATPDYNEAGDVFLQYIGSEGSAKKAIEKCKAAVLYPPLGLPLLLHGASGVGKSFLAQLIFDYLHEKKYNGAQNFFVFNCADYANNPELLSSILFGHIKGAFTGAEKEKKGLLAQADNGVLFLDEVHRLSHENQEKLFQFMDTGKFRPVGEEAELIHSNVRLLFATTEIPEEVLLPTFYRRISVIIDLPTFHERPIFERIELVKYLFERESKRIKKSITISNDIFSALATQELSGNIGSLANQVRMACADALRISPNSQELVVGENKQPVIQINYPPAPTLVEDTHLFVKKITPLLQITDFVKLKEELRSFDSRYLENTVTLINDSLALNIKTSIQKQNRCVIDNELMTKEALETVCRLLQVLKGELSSQKIEEKMYLFSKQYPRTLLLVTNLTKNVPSEVQNFVAFFLGILLIGKVSEEIRYQALLVAHGNATASSIQAVANKMCGDYVFDAINMPLSSSARDIVAEVNDWLSERDTSEGVIMLVDMGSLTQLYKSLKPQILGELLVINNLTTSYALEIGQQLVNGNLFYEIAKKAERDFVTNVQYFEGFSVEKNVIIASISGRDVAKKIKAICEKYFNPDIKLIVLNFSELVNTLERAYSEEGYLKETAAILTTSYLDNKTPVTNINLIDVLDEDAENQLNMQLKNLIHPSSIPLLVNEFIHFFSKEGLSEKLEFLNPDVIIRQVEDVVGKCEKRFSLQLNAKMKFNLMMHIALMVERTILGAEDYPVPEDINQLSINSKPFYQNVQTIFYTLEQFYKIKISTWELYIIYEILIG